MIFIENFKKLVVRMVDMGCICLKVYRGLLCLMEVDIDCK